MRIVLYAFNRVRNLGWENQGRLPGKRNLKEFSNVWVLEESY